MQLSRLRRPARRPALRAHEPSHRVHLPLVVEAGCCEIRVAEDVGAWVEGRAIALRRQLRARSLNRGSGHRLVLIVDLWASREAKRAAEGERGAGADGKSAAPRSERARWGKAIVRWVRMLLYCVCGSRSRETLSPAAGSRLGHVGLGLVVDLRDLDLHPLVGAHRACAVASPSMSCSSPVASGGR